MKVKILNESLRFVNLFLCAFFLTYYFSLFIGIPSDEAKALGFIMILLNIIASFKRILALFK